MVYAKYLLEATSMTVYKLNTIICVLMAMCKQRILSILHFALQKYLINLGLYLNQYMQSSTRHENQ